MTQKLQKMGSYEAGQQILVTCSLERIHDGSKRFWVRIALDKPAKAIFIRYINLYDGEMVREDVEDPFRTWTRRVFEATKIHKAAWICRKGFSPEKVMLEDIKDVNF